jgi:hypothetical protein
MRVANVVTWKSPLGLSYSAWKRGRNVDAWRGEFVGYYDRLRALGLPVLKVSVDDLLQDPGQQLRALCEALRMPYFHGKERFWEKQHHQLFGSPSVRRAVQQRTGTLRRAEDIPETFWQQGAAYASGIERDRNLQEIVAWLRASANEVNGIGPAERAWLRPGWYYRRRLVLLYRRWFPMQWTPEVP